MLIFTFLWILPNFWIIFGQRWKDVFSSLVSAALFPPFVIILENKLDALGRKSLILRVQLAIQKSSENMDP